MRNDENKENIDPMFDTGQPHEVKRVKILHRPALKKKRPKYKIYKLPKNKLKGKIAEEVYFSSETYDLFSRDIKKKEDKSSQ
ncbi:hypothetical protein EHP00_1774 [Ecytonucleospora hepatopenaei]|uniref:Uncharacterized protein n=1 Tax=Ecytonucleospora hepatopenaei TaxID=646526 RepID=A0A1W0E3L6_9MICR|nr:hypothetical protein EHP00_1774 [Ecytonucleospora hepatopenaei]